LDHRIPTNGYHFQEKEQAPNIIPEKIAEHNLSIDQIKAAKAKQDIKSSDGSTIPYQSLTTAAKKPRSFAYCSDTRYKPDIIPLIKNVDLLYHEATFLHERLDLAEYTRHTTAKEAGMVAKGAAAKKLLIGHYSSRYDDVQPLVDEAKTQFHDVEAALSGRTFSL